MATHDYVIANASGAAVRSDLNDALAAIVSNNSNSSEPSTTYAYQWWVDTSNNVLKIRNSSNTAWTVVYELGGTQSGTVIYTARTTAPVGYLKANGAAVSRTTYADLFAAIGTTYGVGDGSTTFNLPDLRGEFLRSLDDGRGVDSGRTLGSAQSSQNLAHNHTASATSSVSDPGHAHAYRIHQPEDRGGGNTATADNGLESNASVSTNSAVTGISVSTAVTVNNNGGSEARPRNVALLACIKT